MLKIKLFYHLSVYSNRDLNQTTYTFPRRAWERGTLLILSLTYVQVPDSHTSQYEDQQLSR